MAPRICSAWERGRIQVAMPTYGDLSGSNPLCSIGDYTALGGWFFRIEGASIS
jgi:hypothetical protein